MQDERLNIKGSKIGFRRPVLEGVSMELQTRKLEDWECKHIFDTWRDVVGHGSSNNKVSGALRKGDALLVYDMSYLGTSFRRTLDMWRDVLSIGAIVVFTSQKARQYPTWEEQDRWVAGLSRNAGRYRKDGTKKAIASNKKRKYKVKLEPSKYLSALDMYLHREGTVRAVCEEIRHDGRKGIYEATLYNWIDKISIAIANKRYSYQGISEAEWKHHLQDRDIRLNKKTGLYEKIKL